MKKINKILLMSLVSFFLLLLNVSADTYNESDVEDGSFVVGTHIFTGELPARYLMLASGTISSEDVDDMLVYYKIMDGFWLEDISGEDISDAMSEKFNGGYKFCITHIDGEKLEDTSCADTTVPSVTVQFVTNSEGQTDDFEVSVKVGELLPLPKDPVRIGYVFDKWTLVVDGESTEEEFDFENTLITEEITLEANWKPITYTIKYHNYDGELKNTFDYSNDEDLTASLVNPEKDGYKFIGWSLVDNTDKTYNRNVKLVDLVTDAVSANLVEIVTEEEVTSYVINVYTNWETNTYEITYVNDGNYDEEGNVTTYTYEDESVTLVNPSNTATKNGYKFIGWSLKDTADIITIDDLIQKQENVELVANWEAIEYKVVFNGNGGLTQDSLETYTMENSCSYDNECVLDENPFAKSGYSFVGWSDTVDGQSMINDKDDINGKGLILNTVENGYVVNLYAVWIINEYSINYDLVDGSFEGEAIYSYNVNTIDELVNATKNGYKFIGWSLKDTTDIVTINDLVQKLEDVELVANWEAIQYNVVFNGNGGLTSDSLDTYGNINKCEYNEECLLDENLFVRNGYEFVGWSTEIFGEVQYNDQSDVNSVDIYSLLLNENDEYTLNLYAVWNIVNYSITYELNGGLFESNRIEKYNVETFDELVNPVRTGYTFEGWKLNDTIVSINELKNILTDVTLTASWINNVYTISYHGINTDGTLPVDQVKYDENYTIKTLDNVDGKVFLGWSLEENGSVYYGAGIEVKNLSTGNDDINLYPVYLKTDYSINYALLGGSFVEEYTPVTSYNIENIDTLNSELPLAENMIKEGYTFAGWLDGNGNEVTSIDYYSLKDLVYIASWEAVVPVESYKIDYDFDGDKVADTEEYESYSNLVLEYTKGEDTYLFVPELSEGNIDGTFAGFYILKDSEYISANFDTCVSEGETPEELICINSTSELTGDILILPMYNYSITYDIDDDGVVDGDQYPELVTSYNTLDIGKSLVNPTNVIDGALEFDSWVLTSNNEAVITTLDKGLGNLELTGTWVYNVIYDINVDELSLPSTYSTKANELVLDTYVPDIDGSTFVKYQYSFDELAYDDVPSCDDKYCLDITDASGDVYIKVLRNYTISYIDMDEEVIESNTLPKTHNNDIERITLPILTSEDENTVFKGYKYKFYGKEASMGEWELTDAELCDDVVNKYCVIIVSGVGPITITAVWEHIIPYSGITEDEITNYGLPKTYLSTDEVVKLPEITSDKENVEFTKYQYISTNINEYSDISMCDDDETFYCIDVSESQILDVMVVWGYDINYTNLNDDEVVSYGLPTSHSTLDSVVKLPKITSSDENVKFNSYKYKFTSLIDINDTTEAVDANECDENNEEYCISLPGDYLLNIEVVWEYEITYSEEVVDLPTSYLSTDTLVVIEPLNIEDKTFVGYNYKFVDGNADILPLCEDQINYCYDPKTLGYQKLSITPIWEYNISYSINDENDVVDATYEEEFLMLWEFENKFNTRETSKTITWDPVYDPIQKILVNGNEIEIETYTDEYGTSCVATYMLEGIEEDISVVFVF